MSWLDWLAGVLELVLTAQMQTHGAQGNVGREIYCEWPAKEQQIGGAGGALTGCGSPR